MLFADDSMISMTYARNLFQYGELVWQQGDRVMGITNLGWTLLIAPTFMFHLPARIATLPILFLNFIIDLLLILLVFRAILKRGGLFCATLFTALLAIATPLIFFSILGFETPLQALLLTAAMLSIIPNGDKKYARLVDSPLRTFLLLAAATVVRPDSGLFFAILSGAAIYDALILKKERLFHSRAVRAIFYGGMIIVAMLVAQKMYYGAWLPNTFLLKATGGARSLYIGWNYFTRALIFEGILPILIFALIGLANWIRNRNSRAKGIWLTITIFAWMGYIVWTGGDAIPHFRFILPLLPVLFITGANGLRVILNIVSSSRLSFREKIAPKKFFALLLLATIVVITIVFVAAPLTDVELPYPHTVDRVFVAEALQKAELSSNTTIALFEAGTLPFLLPKFHYHDLLGKNDRHIAKTKAHKGMVGHNKWDFDYSLGKIEPDIIVTRDNYEGLSDAIAQKLIKNADKLPRDAIYFPIYLWLDPLFIKYYRNNHIRIDTPYHTHWVFSRNGADIGELKFIDDR